jgi:hypothetical protein
MVFMELCLLFDTKIYTFEDLNQMYDMPGKILNALPLNLTNLTKFIICTKRRQEYSRTKNKLITDLYSFLLCNILLSIYRETSFSLKENDVALFRVGVV